MPSCFGWQLVEWEPLIEQCRKQIDRKPTRVFGKIHEILEIGEETLEEGKIELDLGTGDVHVHGVGGGDPILEDYPRDSFEKVGEVNLEEDPQTPTEPVLLIPSEETLTNAEPRRKRVKTLAGRTDLPWVQKLLAQQSTCTPTSHQPAPQTPQPTRKSHGLAAQGFAKRSSSIKQGPPVIEEIESSQEGSPINNPKTPASSQTSPVLKSEQGSTETIPLSKQTPSSRPILKRKPAPNKVLHPNQLKNLNQKGPRPR